MSFKKYIDGIKRRRSTRTISKQMQGQEGSYYKSRSKYFKPGIRRYIQGRGVYIATLLGVIIVASLCFVIARSTRNDDAEDAVAATDTAVTAQAATPSPTPTPTPRSKAVALTFDDGPSRENTPRILQTLQKYNAHATFFVVGNRVKADADILKQEIEAGCEIGNHSWSHANLAKMDMDKVNRQYDRTANLIKKLTGYDVKLLRPPYGAISNKMRKKLKHPMILWNVDTRDWENTKTKAILKQVKKNVKDGDIILMHDIHSTTADALETVIQWLIKNDYDILTVSELAERQGAQMSDGKAYGGFSGE